YSRTLLSFPTRRSSDLEISFTAPIYGPKMWAAQAEAGDLEAQILAEAGITLEDFQRAKVDGGRRLGRLLLPDLQFQLGEADGALDRKSTRLNSSHVKIS